MKLPVRVSVLFFLGVFAAGSTALGYYYYYFYSPPLVAAENFMSAMETGNEALLRQTILIAVGPDSATLREPTGEETAALLREDFQRGRILDQRKREGRTRDFDYLVYREPNGQVYALVATKRGNEYRIVIPDRSMAAKRPYLWEYAWTN